MVYKSDRDSFHETSLIYSAQILVSLTIVGSGVCYTSYINMYSKQHFMGQTRCWENYRSGTFEICTDPELRNTF